MGTQVSYIKKECKQESINKRWFYEKYLGVANRLTTATATSLTGMINGFIDWDESTDLNDKMLNLLYSFSVNMKPI